MRNRDPLQQTPRRKPQERKGRRELLGGSQKTPAPQNSVASKITPPTQGEVETFSDTQSSGISLTGLPRMAWW